MEFTIFGYPSRTVDRGETFLSAEKVLKPADVKNPNEKVRLSLLIPRWAKVGFDRLAEDFKGIPRGQILAEMIRIETDLDRNDDLYDALEDIEAEKARKRGEAEKKRKRRARAKTATK
jgi:hypothetical protein